MTASAATLTRWRGRWHLSDVLDATPSHDLPDNMVAQVEALKGFGPAPEAYPALNSFRNLGHRPIDWPPV
jgi:hypothetical protein